MLIKRWVVDELEPPWFYSTPSTNGRTALLNEDFTFCTYAKSIGARIFATADVGHRTSGVFNVRPLYRNGRARSPSSRRRWSSPAHAAAGGVRHGRGRCLSCP